MGEDDRMTRGEVARRTGVGIETVRYYEKRGLLEEPPRTPAGYRQYGGATLSRLHFIRRAKQLGFSLSEVKGLIALRLDPDADCADIERRAQAHLGDVRQKIRDLARMETALEELTAACRANSRKKAECPLLEALEPDDGG